MFDRFLSADARNFRPSAIRAFAKWINDPNVISFGSPSPETFPAERLSEIAERVVRERRAVALQYGPTRGLPRLCEFVASLCRAQGIACTPEEVILTTGSQQALDLIAHTLLDPGDVVAVELPTYIGGTSSFYARSARLTGVLQDDDGIVPLSLAEVARKTRPKLLYVIPNFQNPSGRLMSQPRREQVLQIAREQDFVIIEDDPYGELVYVDGADITPMKSRDTEGRVSEPSPKFWRPDCDAAGSSRRRCSSSGWKSPSRRPTSAPQCSISRLSMRTATRESCPRRSSACACSMEANAG